MWAGTGKSIEADMIEYVKKKLIRLIKRPKDGTTNVQTETERADGVTTVSEYITFDCGCHFDHSKLVIYEHNGEKFFVCESCCVECWSCKRKVWANYATRIGDVWLCPGHVFSGSLKLALEAIKRKED
jgi:hypothetical protein